MADERKVLAHSAEQIDEAVEKVLDGTVATKTDLQNKAPSGYGYDGANSSLLLLNFISGDTVDDKLTTLFNSMVNASAVQIYLSDTSFSGYEMHGTLYKLSNYHGGYATAVFNGYDDYSGIPVTVRKVLREGVWGPYEYFTPPMYIGKEYRTTERYQGKPVYAKTIDLGALPNNERKNVSIGASIAVALSCNLSFGKSGTYTYSAPFYGGADIGGISVTAHITGSNVCCVTTADYSDFTAVVLCKYTKSTD